MGRYVYKIGEYITHFEISPWINYQGDMYIGEDGVCYEMTLDPKIVDFTR